MAPGKGKELFDFAPHAQDTLLRAVDLVAERIKELSPSVDE